MIRKGAEAAATNSNSDPKNGNGAKANVPYYKTPAYLRAMANIERERAVQIPKAKEVPASEALTFLKSMGTGWDAELEALLTVPPRLFYLQLGAYSQYSGTDSMDMGGVLQSLKAGGRSFSTRMEYGFMVYDSASATHFVLFDAKRRIVVRGIVQEYGEDGGQSWAGIKHAIETALKRAAGSTAVEEGLIAVYDDESYLSALAKLETVH